MPAEANQRLLQHYLQELDYLKDMGGEFAARYPKVARRLQWDGGPSSDPNVDRLIESFAFLTARLRADLDDEFPELVSGLLDILYPHYLAPLPSMSIARFSVDPTSGKLLSGYDLPARTPLFASTEDGQCARFRTGYPVTLWPVDLRLAELRPAGELTVPSTWQTGGLVLHWRLDCLGARFEQLNLRRLRVYLNGDWTTVGPLYDLLTAGAEQILIRNGDIDTDGTIYPAARLLQPVGFAADEALLPSPGNAHPAARLLREHSAFPQKFLFFDLDLATTQPQGEHLDIYFRIGPAQARNLNVSRDNFLLGCTPVINLFSRAAEPLRLDHRASEYRLVPDARRERTTEIHSIELVRLTGPDGQGKPVPPLFSYRETASETGGGIYWHAKRRPVLHRDQVGTDVYLSFIDTDLNPQQPPGLSVHTSVLCTNRCLAEQVPAGARLDIESAIPGTVVCLHAPTPPVTPPLDGAAQWRLISQLSLNHLSLVDEADGTAALRRLRELLEVCDVGEGRGAQQRAGLRAIKCRRIVRRIGHDAWRGICRGLGITLEIDESAHVGGSAVLWGSVLNHFFAGYAAINSFTELTLQRHQRNEVIKTWPPMAGAQIIL